MTSGDGPNEGSVTVELRRLSAALNERRQLADWAIDHPHLAHSNARLHELRTVAAVDRMPPGQTRFVRSKRFVLRFLRLSTHRQAHVNHELIDVTSGVIAHVEQLRAEVVHHRSMAAASQAALEVALESIEEQAHDLRESTDIKLARLRDDLARPTVDVRTSIEAVKARLAATSDTLGIQISSLAAQRIEDERALLVKINASVAATLDERLSAAAATLSNDLGVVDAHSRSTRAAISTLSAAIDRITSDLRHLSPPQVDAESIRQLDAARSAVVDLSYRAFEDRQRGDMSAVRASLTAYLTDIEERREIGGTVVDIGCGRGEWISLLTQHGLQAVGVDSNEAQASAGRDDGLNIVVGDGFEYLATLEPGSCLAVTSFHVLEHVSSAQQRTFLELALRALRPGGIVIVETPNPTNLIVGAASFYTDPTHIRPIHPNFMEFLADDTGYVGVEIRYLHPRDEFEQLTPTDDQLANDIRWALYGPQDFALIARRP